MSLGKLLAAILVGSFGRCSLRRKYYNNEEENQCVGRGIMQAPAVLYPRHLYSLDRCIWSQNFTSQNTAITRLDLDKLHCYTFQDGKSGTPRCQIGCCYISTSQKQFGNFPAIQYPMPEPTGDSHCLVCS